MIIIKTINIMHAADENYATQLCVAINSIVEHNSPETHINFYIIDKNLSSKTKSTISVITQELHSVEYITLDFDLCKDFPVRNHINETSYYRIIATKTLREKGLDRVLYLDVDILAQVDLTPLFECDLEGAVVGGIPDPVEENHLARLDVLLELAEQNKYINSGILLIDLNRWEEEQINEQIINFLDKKPHLVKFHDQDGLNAVVTGKVKLLNPRWNQQTAHSNHPDKVKHPAIIHFTTHEKPWHASLHHPYADLYHEYLARVLEKVATAHRDAIHVVSAVNPPFIKTLSVLYRSLLEHNGSDAHIILHVLMDHLSTSDRQELEQTIAPFNAELNFIDVDESKLVNCVESARILKLAYYRILIPELIPEAHRAIYLDCDVLCKTDISELWNIDLEGKPLAAVEDAGFHLRLEAMGIDFESQKYFNSGILVMDLDKWREESITDQVLDFIKNNPEKLKFHDQDALNAVLHDNWKELPQRWNAQTNVIVNRITPLCPIRKKDYIDARKNPKLIHFCGHIKPWHKETNHPYAVEYEQYVSKIGENSLSAQP